MVSHNYEKAKIEYFGIEDILLKFPAHLKADNRFKTQNAKRHRALSCPAVEVRGEE